MCLQKKKKGGRRGGIYLLDLSFMEYIHHYGWKVWISCVRAEESDKKKKKEKKKRKAIIFKLDVH